MSIVIQRGEGNVENTLDRNNVSREMRVTIAVDGVQTSGS